VTTSSGRKAWWKCTLGHTWRATVDSRTRENASGCPYCANKAVLPGFNDLTTTHPALAAEWDHGNTTTAQQVTAGSSMRAAWRCKAGHVWRVAISSRVGRRTGCPYCSNKAVLAGFNDLATANPDLAAEWDGTIGANDRTPSEVTPRSDYRASWKCDRGHTWQASVSNRGAGHGCPYCCGQRVIPGETDLATIRPDLAAEWDPENALTPDQATPSSHRKVSWRCKKGHSWQATIANRSNGHGCPYCVRSRVIPGETDLATLRPDLVAEWAPLNALTPQEVSISSNRRVLWKCDAGHMWEAVISSRTRTRCTGCPHCAGRCNVRSSPGEWCNRLILRFRR
jgi:hypothetical protein